MKKILFLILSLVLFWAFAQPLASQAASSQYDTVVLRGNADALDWSSNNNPLQFNEEQGVWISKPIPLEGGKAVEYKFVYDGEWMPGANLSFAPPQDADYIFVFHPDNERTVDVRLADTKSGSLTLELTVPDGTPDWVTPTVAHSLNGFNYKVSTMTKVTDQTYKLRVVGEAGESLSYVYSLGGQAYKENREEPRTATFTSLGTVYQDSVANWQTVPVAQDVHHDFQHDPYVPSHQDDVTVTVTVKHYGPIDKGAVYYTTDGSSPLGKRGDTTNGSMVPLEIVDVSTESGLTTTTMEAIIPRQQKETPVKYILDVWNSESTGSQFADTNALSPELATEFAYYVDDYEAPDWAKEAIIYHVFVDRFRDGSTANNTSVDPTLPHDEALKGWMGGDLQGLIEKLDYIDDLGVNAIWVSPIYEGPYSHGYHPTDFMKVDPRFGSNELMKKLVEEAHEREIKVIYDLVPNHTSDQHPFFQDALENGPDSPYFDWYTFTDWPNEYEGFYGIKELPELNNDNPETRDYMLNEVVPFWLKEIGVDGFRLDYAMGPSQSFWVDFRHKVKEIDPSTYIFGEVWDSLETVTSYTGKLDGAIDFETQGAIYNAIINETSLGEVGRHLTTISEAYHDEFVPATFLDSHDKPRFLFEANGNVEKLKKAVALQFSLPGAPIIYYGDEVGLSQSGDHNSVTEWKDRYYREPMIWDPAKQNLELKAFYEKWIDIRKDHEALTHGELKVIYSEQNLLVFERKTKNDHVVMVLNRAEEARELDMKNLYNHDRPNRVTFTSLLEGTSFTSKKAHLPVQIEGNSYTIFDVKGDLRYQEPDEEKMYTSVVVRGGNPLDWSSDTHSLIYDQTEQVWKSEPVYLEAGKTVPFKYVMDGVWLEGDNLSFTPEVSGEYVFVFDPQNERYVHVVLVSTKLNAA